MSTLTPPARPLLADLRGVQDLHAVRSFSPWKLLRQQGLLQEAVETALGK